MTIQYQKAQFVLSAAKLSQLPQDRGKEVAIVGRSNAGKSSVLNCLTRQKALARVSKTPGRTQLINVFSLDDKHRLMDLPGYGFAHVPKAVRLEWQALLEEYFENRESLAGVLLIMDIRHPMQPLDYALIEYCLHAEIPVHILLNKADKLSFGKAKMTMHEVMASLQDVSDQVSVQLFSALKRTGLEVLVSQLNNWYLSDL